MAKITAEMVREEFEAADDEKPLCMMCGGTCQRLWEHFGEGENPDYLDDFEYEDPDNG